MKPSANWCGLAKSAVCRLRDLPAERMTASGPAWPARLPRLLGVANALEAMQSYGSTAPAEVDRQLQLWSDRLAAR